MKKSTFAIGALTLLFAASTYAKPQYCGYTDHFHTDQNAPAALIITNLNNDGNVTTQQTDWSQFNISDATNCPTLGGYAYVSYSVDGSHFCNLTIKDGPYITTPSVSANCQGLSFNGISTDKTSHMYTLKFS